MKTQSKVLIGISIASLLGLAVWFSLMWPRNQGIEVRLEAIEYQDLVEIVTASGNIRARRTVDISSDVSARVTELLVDEGADVEILGVLDLICRHDPGSLGSSGVEPLAVEPLEPVSRGVATGVQSQVSA